MKITLLLKLTLAGLVAGALVPQSFSATLPAKPFAGALRGQAGTPREWAYVQLGSKWFVREPGFKMNESAELFDMSDAPFVEKPISPSADTSASKAARQRLTAVLVELNPAGGKKDARGADEQQQQKKKA